MGPVRQIMAVVAIALSASAVGAQHSASSVRGAAEARQAVRAIRLLPGFQVGGILPTGELGDFYNTGLRAGATLTAVAPLRPYAVRLALTYDRLSGGTITPPGESVLVEVAAGSMVSLSLHGIVSERSERSSLLYLTAGVGVHRLDAAGAASFEDPDEEPTDVPDEIPTVDTETKFGGAVGGGIAFSLGGLPSFLEVQIVKLFGADAVFVPVVVGVQLGR